MARLLCGYTAIQVAWRRASRLARTFPRAPQMIRARTRRDHRCLQSTLRRQYSRARRSAAFCSMPMPPTDNTPASAAVRQRARSAKHLPGPTRAPRRFLSCAGSERELRNLAAEPNASAGIFPRNCRRSPRPRRCSDSLSLERSCSAVVSPRRPRAAPTQATQTPGSRPQRAATRLTRAGAW